MRSSRDAVRSRRVVAAALAALLASGVAHGQALSCQAPQRIDPPHADGPTADQPRRLMPIGGYTLALSWSPEYCRRRADDPRDRQQCGGGNRFGFTLHGLWPDGQSDSWPQYCKPAALLPEATLRRNLCDTPSAQLLQHEWAKHGTCTGLDPDRYFAQSTALYRKLRFPDMAALSRRTVTARAVSTAFARANPGLRPEMVKLNVNKRGWFEEAWICLGGDLRPRACRSFAGAAAPDSLVKIWRGGRPGRRDDADRGDAAPS